VVGVLVGVAVWWVVVDRVSVGVGVSVAVGVIDVVVLESVVVDFFPAVLRLQPDMRVVKLARSTWRYSRRGGIAKPPDASFKNIVFHD